MSISKLIEGNNYKLEPVQYYLRTFYPGYTMTPHSHNYFEIMYVESGEFSFYAQKNDCMNEFTINERQFVFLDSDVIHYMTVKNSKVKIYNFEFSLANEEKNDLQIVYKLNNIPSVVNFIKGLKSLSILNDSADVLMILKSIHAALDDDKNDTESRYLLQALIFSLLINIGKCTSPPQSVHSIYIMKTLNIIDKNLTSNLSPKHLAKKLDISESYLHRLFKESTGTTIINYVNKKRTELARILLSETNDSVIEIAINVGFNTRQNFGQIFRKFTGMTPSEYRKQQKQKEYDIPIQQEKIFKQKSYPENKPN